VKPYYQDGAVTIYHGDCREIVPTLGRFDLLLTDPPYGDILTRKHGHGKLKEAAKRYGGGEWDVRPNKGLIRGFVDTCNFGMVWGGNHFASELPDARGWLVWDKRNGDSSFADAELCWTNFDMAVRMKACSVQSIDARTHPTQKPIQIMLWCIGLAGDVQTILDPFAGSGTTGRAAKDLGRKATLIEREERYCEIAAIRMAQDVLDFGTANNSIVS
jgi:site-specific DNA-methyltransferase (adenine-specific)